MKASKAFYSIIFTFVIIMASFPADKCYAGNKIHYLDANLPDDKSPRSFERKIINGIELGTGPVFLGMSYSDVKSAVQNAGYVDIGMTYRDFERAININGDDYRIRAKGGSRYEVHNTQPGMTEELIVYFTPGVERAYLIIQTFSFSDTDKMPQVDDMSSQIRQKYGAPDVHAQNACRSFSDTQRFDAGACWLPDNMGQFAAEPMLSNGVHSYITITASSHNTTHKVNHIEYNIFSAALKAEEDKLWDKTVEDAIANIPPPAEPFSFSERAPQSHEENSNAKLAALVMFGADVEKKLANSQKDGVIIRGEWVNTSENPLIFHNVQDDQEMVVEEISECAYKADISVRKPNEGSSQKTEHFTGKINASFVRFRFSLWPAAFPAHEFLISLIPVNRAITQDLTRAFT